MSEKKEHDGLQDSVIGAVATENIERYGRAAGEYIKGYKGEVGLDGATLKKGLKQVAESKVNPDYRYQNIKQQAGFSAEIHYVNKENADSIINKTNRTIYRSNDIGRGNDPKFDVLSIDENGDPTWGAQMKFCGKFSTQKEINDSAKFVADRLASDKWERYRGNSVLVPSEQYKAAKKYALKTSENYYNQAQKCRQEGNIEKVQMLEERAVRYQQVSKDLTDSGISSKEAIFLREYPKLATAKYVIRTAHQSGMENAKSAAILSMTISTARNIAGVLQNDKEVSEAVYDIGKDTLDGAVSGYLIGAGDTAIRGVMNSSSNSVFVNLSKTNLPAMIATTTVQVGKSLIRYVNGEINSLELVEELGEKGTGMMAASLGAAIGTGVFPGVGTVIGGMIGYMTSSTIYNSCMLVLKEERISEERREKIHYLAEAAIESMSRQGRELSQLIDIFYSNRKKVFDESLKSLEKAYEKNDLELFTQGLNAIAIEMGEVLQFKNFDEFDQFMLDKDAVLNF